MRKPYSIIAQGDWTFHQDMTLAGYYSENDFWRPVDLILLLMQRPSRAGNGHRDRSLRAVAIDEVDRSVSVLR